MAIVHFSTPLSLLCKELDDTCVPDQTQLEILLSQLTSEEADQVSEAQSLFSQVKTSRLNSLSIALSRLLSSGLPDIRSQAALRLGELFTQFPFVDETTLEIIKSALLSAFRNILLKLDVDNLFQVISDLYATERWPELVSFMFECVNFQTPNLQEYALLIFKRLAEERTGKFLIPHLNTFRKTFFKCLGNCSCWNVRIAAFDASINFVRFIPNSQEDPNRFQYLLPLMMKTLTDALNSGSEYMAEDSLQLLIQLARKDPSFFERQLEKVLRLFLKIVVDDSLELDIRHLAIEFLMSLVEMAPNMIRKVPKFIRRLFDELMYMLFDVEGGDEVDNYWESSNYVLGKECLSKLSNLLGEKTIFPSALRLLSYLSSTTIWQQRHAALIAIPKVATGTSEVLLEDLEEIVSQILKSVNDSHPRVRLAAINAIRWLSVDFCQLFQIQYHEIVLITLLKVMDDFQNPELQIPAASAVLIFFKYGTKDILDLYKTVISEILGEFCKSRSNEDLESSYGEKQSFSYDLYRIFMFGKLEPWELNNSVEQMAEPGQPYPLDDLWELVEDIERPPGINSRILSCFRHRNHGSLNNFRRTNGGTGATSTFGPLDNLWEWM